MTTSGATSDKEWQQVIQLVTTCDNKEEWVTASDSSDTTIENSTVHFKEWNYCCPFNYKNRHTNTLRDGWLQLGD